MRSRLRLVLMLVLACLLIGATGCGGDDGGDGGDTTTVQTPEATPEETVAPEDSPDTGDAPVDEGDIEAAVERCKRNIEAQPQLSDDTKRDLEELCDKAVDDPEAAQDAAREVCRKIVEDTLAEGQPGREEALEACEQSGR